MRRPKRLGLGVLAATVAVLPAIWSVGHAANLETRNIDLHQAKVSVVSGSRVVVSMEASGDLRGLLTLTIDRDNNGHLSGEWALVVRYVQDVDASGNPIKPDFDESQGEPQERIQLIDKGTLSGAI